MKIVVKPSDYRYLEEICELENRVFPDPWSNEAIYNLMHNDTSMIVVAVDEKNKLVGYGGFMLMYDEVHIVRVCVNENYRHTGIGKALMVAMIACCERNNLFDLTLEVRASNEYAIKLYEKCGFKTEGVRPNYYQDNHEDAVIMWRHKEEA